MSVGGKNEKISADGSSGLFWKAEALQLSDSGSRLGLGLKWSKQNRATGKSGGGGRISEAGMAPSLCLFGMEGVAGVSTDGGSPKTTIGCAEQGREQTAASICFPSMSVKKQ